MAIIRVQAEDFNVSIEIATLTAGRVDIGGIGSFIGTVRQASAGRQITAMGLEHYPGMTERAMTTIAEAAEARFNLIGCTLIHRVGDLRPGENIVLVLTASPHRHAALEGCAFLIDWLKTRAPFWKRECFADGTAAWVDAREADDTAAAKWGAV